MLIQTTIISTQILIFYIWKVELILWKLDSLEIKKLKNSDKLLNDQFNLNHPLLLNIFIDNLLHPISLYLVSVVLTDVSYIYLNT